ncbi:MAG: ribosome maturation factor RimP [Pseudobacteriovorax sp.]|nr:ribosome maturation factor RimP [Pseudobacteriovorax sp.]
MNRQRRNDIIDTIQSALVDTNYECLEVEWQPADKTLRVFIDGPQTVLIDDCVKVSRILDGSEDFDHFFPSAYRLEVSSPGVERPLRTAKHFASEVGSQVSVELTESFEGRKKASGKVITIENEDKIRLELESGEIWSMPINLLKSANLVYDW